MFLITQQSFNIVRNDNEINLENDVVENQIEKIDQFQKIDDNNSNEKFDDQKTQSRDQEYDIETQLNDFLDRHRNRTSQSNFDLFVQRFKNDTSISSKQRTSRRFISQSSIQQQSIYSSSNTFLIVIESNINDKRFFIFQKKKKIISRFMIELKNKENFKFSIFISLYSTTL